MKRKFVKLLGVTLSTMLVLASCATPEDSLSEVGNVTEELELGGGAESDSTYTIISDEDVANPAVTRTGADNTFVITGSAPPSGVFNPNYYSSSYDAQIVNLVFDGLLYLGTEGEYEPLVAESYEISEDGRTYTFHLREGVTFSDGEELTAEDVEFTYTMLADPTYDGKYGASVDNIVGYEEYSAPESTVESLEGIEIIDDYTISFTFYEPERTNIAIFDKGIMPAHYYAYEKGNLDPVKEKNMEPLGSGRYVMDRFEVDQFVELSRREDYPLADTTLGEASIDKVIWKVVDDSLNVQQLVAGELDMVPAEISPEKISEALDTGFINAQVYPRSGYGYLRMNVREGHPTSDKRVRQALQYGYDGELFNQIQYEGLAVTQDVPFSQVSWAYTDELKNSVTHYGYDPEKANQLLDEAGWLMEDDGFRYKDGEKLVLRIPAMPDHSVLDTLVPLLIEQWGALGIELEVSYMEFNSLLDKVFYGDGSDWDLYFMATTWTSPDPDQIYSAWHSSGIGNGGDNSSAYSNPEMDALLDEGRRTLEIEDAIPIYEEVGRMMNDEAVYIVVYANLYHDLYNNRVQGVNTNSLWQWQYDISNFALDTAY